MTAPYYTDATVQLHHGDCLDVLRDLPDASVDAVVTDPPYGLEFMGKEWDAPWKASSVGRGVKVEGERSAEMTTRGKGHSTAAGPYLAARVDSVRVAGLPFQQWCELWTAECLRVLKPGGHLLAFGGTRTWHRLACAVEDAGFEVRDSIAWMYGSGFPKSLDVSKAIDKAAGHWRGQAGSVESENSSMGGPNYERTDKGDPITDDARTWQGWGTALKPAFEPVVVARKPLAGTVAANVLAWGTGALNVDGCRVEGGARPLNGSSHGGSTPAGRWPANVVLDEGQAEALDAQSGESASRQQVGARTGKDAGTFGAFPGQSDVVMGHDDQGGASRFFYVAKADASERVRMAGVAHPTVKPLALMRWLVRLVTPPGGVVLEPFAGSGTTVEACILEGFRCIAIEREADYLPLIEQRIHRRRDPVAAVRGSGEDGGLFDLLGEEPA